MPLNRFTTFLPVTLLFLAGIPLFFYFHINSQLSFWYLISWMSLFSIIQFLGAYFIGLNFHLRSVNSLNTAKKKVMLTFDDGPHAVNTCKVLDVLKKHDVKAMFFVIGKNIGGNETVLKRLISEDHSIGNHSFSHHYFIDLWSSKKVMADFLACQELIEYYVPNQKIVRPPFGVTNPNIAKAFKKLGLQSIGWNIRSYDTNTSDTEKIKQRILSKLKPGAIILLHDRLPYMPELLEILIPAIKEKGYGFELLFNRDFAS